MPLGPAFQTPFDEQIRSQADIATMTLGFIWDAKVADNILREGRADLVALAPEVLHDPNWPLHAARELGIDGDFSLWKPQFGWWLNKRERVLQKLGLREK